MKAFTRCLMCVTLVTGWIATAAAQLTAEQAATLPESELANVVLGGLGRLVVHVGRPAWPRSVGPTSHAGAPPLRYLTFDLMPEDRGAGGYSGVCQAERLQVFFNEAGQTASLRSDILIGVASKLESTPRGGSAAKSCAKVTSLDRFFYPWNGPQDADSVMPAVQQIEDYLDVGSKLSFPITCKHDQRVTDCKRERWNIDVREVNSIVERQCSREEHSSSSADRTCYMVSLAGFLPASFYTFPYLDFVVDGKNSGQPRVVKAELGLGSGRADPIMSL